MRGKQFRALQGKYIQSTLDIRLIGELKILLRYRFSLSSKGLNMISPIGAAEISTKNLYFISNCSKIENHNIESRLYLHYSVIQKY